MLQLAGRKSLEYSRSQHSEQKVGQHNRDILCRGYGSFRVIHLKILNQSNTYTSRIFNIGWHDWGSGNPNDNSGKIFSRHGDKRKVQEWRQQEISMDVGFRLWYWQVEGAESLKSTDVLIQVKSKIMVCRYLYLPRARELANQKDPCRGADRDAATCETKDS